MKTERIENGIKIITCDSLEEFFEVFKDYRTKKIDVAKKENYNKHVFAMNSHKHNSDEMNIFGLHLILKQNPRKKEMLFFDLSAANLKDDKWLPCEEKIKKILKEIWEKGSTDTKYLDLNSLLEDKPKQNSPIKPNKKESKVVWWICGGVIVVLLLIYLFRKRKKKTKKSL